MIDWLEIDQLAIAKHIELEFGDAFTTVTGETGSGKSLIVGAVGILLGGRCENSLIRHEQDKAEVQGGFTLNDTHPALHWLRENGLDNDNECVLRRVVRRDKSSRAFINGRAVNASQLREIGRELVDIHGQNEHHSLLVKKGQLALLDNAAGNTELIARLADNYKKLSAVRNQIDQLNAHSNFARERADLLQFQVTEIETLAPQPDEWSGLEKQQKRMHHSQDLTNAAHSVAERLCENENSVSVSLAESCRQLQRLIQFDPRLAKIISMLEEASVNIGESAAQLQALYANSTLNPEEIAAIEARFSLYHDLSRKHKVLPGLLGEKLEQLRVELEGLKDPEAELERLQKQWDEFKAEYDEICDGISGNRNNAAQQLSTRVTEVMQELGMVGGTFEIRLQPNVEERISPQGNETTEFVVSANAGMPLQALTKVASGGELSRISLAINVILAADAPASTLMFDEVDVGIGGKVADIVGQKLRRLGDNRQVICITHLSQVAAKGHHHWSVAKQTDAQANVSVHALDHAQRVEEIARMIAGAELTPQSRAHAERLLESA